MLDLASTLVNQRLNCTFDFGLGSKCTFLFRKSIRVCTFEFPFKGSCNHNEASFVNMATIFVARWKMTQVKCIVTDVR